MNFYLWQHNWGKWSRELLHFSCTKGSSIFTNCHWAAAYNCTAFLSTPFLNSKLKHNGDSKSNKWSHALRSGICPDRRRTRRTASARLEVVMQSVVQEQFLKTMAIRGLLDGGSDMVLQGRTFEVASEMDMMAFRWSQQILPPIR